MELAKGDTSFLLTLFREFYAEVVRLKHVAQMGSFDSRQEPATVAATAGTSGFGGARTLARSQSLSAEAAANQSAAIFQRLTALLEGQAIQASRSGGAFAFEMYREAQYVMAALADEVFITLEWDGRHTWPLLENRLFGTHSAGELLFTRLERLLQRRDPFYLDLSMIYFYALALGFQGRYRGAESDPLDELRSQLYTMIYRRNPALFRSEVPLFPQTLQNTASGIERRRLPDPRIWLLLMPVIVVLWIVVSHIAWSTVSSQVSCLVCQLLERGCVCVSGAPAAGSSANPQPAQRPATQPTAQPPRRSVQ